MNHKQHSHYLRLNEALAIVSDLGDQIRERHLSHEKYQPPAVNFLLADPYHPEHAITIIGLAVLKTQYLKLINLVDKYEDKYRPALLESYRESIAQIDSFLALANGKQINIGRLRISVSFGSDDTCTSAPVSSGRGPDHKPDPIFFNK